MQSEVPAIQHLAQAALQLRRAAHRDEIPADVARKFVNWAASIQVLIEAIEASPAYRGEVVARSAEPRVV